VAHSARYWSDHHTCQTRFSNVLSVKHSYTGAFFMGRTSTYLLLVICLSWSERGFNSQSPGRQSSVLPLSQFPKLNILKTACVFYEHIYKSSLLNFNWNLYRIPNYLLGLQTVKSTFWLLIWMSNLKLWIHQTSKLITVNMFVIIIIIAVEINCVHTRSYWPVYLRSKNHGIALLSSYFHYPPRPW